MLLLLGTPERCKLSGQARGPPPHAPTAAAVRRAAELQQQQYGLHFSLLSHSEVPMLTLRNACWMRSMLQLQ